MSVRTSFLERVRPAPDNDIRQLESPELAVKTGFYLVVASLSAYSVTQAPAGSFFWSFFLVGALGCYLLAAPGVIELLARRVEP